MNSSNRKVAILLAISVGINCLSCSRYLDAIPNERLAIPSSLNDLQGLLDGYRLMNASYSPAAELLADDYFITEQDWNALSNETHRNYYIWHADENTISEWNAYSNQIKTANVVLDLIDGLTTAQETEKAQEIKGAALFYRAFYHFNIAQLFSLPFDLQTASTDLGIPIRLTSDFNEPARRSSVEDSYKAIFSDLEAAALLLPEISTLKTRPTVAAAYGMLARVSQAMLQYDVAGGYARKCLEHYKDGGLLDFNSLGSNADAPISQFNPEVIFHCVSNSHTLLQNNRLKIDTFLYASYAPTDLRCGIYYDIGPDGYARFKGDYNGQGMNGGTMFPGVTLSEQYLILAESLARAGETEKALERLGSLLSYRYKAGQVPILLADTPEDALSLVLTERRKELVMRGCRWLDLRRFSKEKDREVVPERRLGDQVYTLMPGSPRWALKLPAHVIQYSDMQQNQ